VTTSELKFEFTSKSTGLFKELNIILTNKYLSGSSTCSPFTTRRCSNNRAL